jgi:hypothetical protein
MLPPDMAVKEIRNYFVRTAVAPSHIGKTAVRQSASDRIEARAAALCRSSSGLTHDQAVERVRQSNPTLAAAADQETNQLVS